MSFSFYIDHPDVPTVDLFEDLGVGPIAWSTWLYEGILEPGSWHVYIDGRSTRVVEVSWEDGRLQVRILVGSSLEDFALATAITRAAARRTGACIEPEDQPPLSLDGLEARYGKAWARRMVDWGARELRSLVFKRGTLTLLGPCRAFDLGYRVVRALDDAGPEATFPDRFLDAVRRVQYLDPRRYHAPEAVHVPLTGGRTISATLWAPDRGYLFPPVKYVHLHAPDGRPLFLPYQVIPELSGVRAAWADERRLLVEPVPRDAWGAVCTQALDYHEAPTGDRPD